MEVHVVVEGIVSPGQQVVQMLRETSDGESQVTYSQFVRGWRQLLLDTLHPRHLPKGWSVDGPSAVFGKG
jgi:hypothetical protein